MTSPNAHVLEFLTYYAALPSSPEYAVMVDGPWGSGKTHVVRKFIDHLRTTGKQVIYISAYGTSTTDDLDVALIEAVYPILGNQYTKLVGKLLKTGASVFGADLDLSVKDIPTKIKPDLYVFDDLERSQLAPNQLLGYINTFVEHDGSKVVVIANQREIDASDEYERIKEKVIGRTVLVAADIDSALSYFMEQLTSVTSKYLQQEAPRIVELYRQYGQDNLRILRQTLLDFDRLYICFDETHTSNSDAMRLILSLFLPLSFEVKSGRLGETDLRTRLSRIVGGMLSGGDEENHIRVADQRYPNSSLGDTVLSDEILVDTLIRGVFSIDDIRQSLNRSIYYAKPGDEPAWRTLWHRFERTDEELNQARATVEKQFAEREFVEPGIMLHVFGLRLSLARDGLLPSSVATIYDQCIDYVNELFAAHRLSPATRDSFDEVRFGGYGGLAMFEANTQEFKDIFDHLQSRREEAFEREIPDRARTLLQHLTGTAETFARQITLTNDGENELYRVPVLSSIDPTTFASAFMGLHPSAQRTVVAALRSRYENNMLARELASERDWLVKVCDTLEGLAKPATFTQVRVKAWIAGFRQYLVVS